MHPRHREVRKGPEASVDLCSAAASLEQAISLQSFRSPSVKGGLRLRSGPKHPPNTDSLEAGQVSGRKSQSWNQRKFQLAPQPQQPRRM